MRAELVAIGNIVQGLQASLIGVGTAGHMLLSSSFALANGPGGYRSCTPNGTVRVKARRVAKGQALEDSLGLNFLSEVSRIVEEGEARGSLSNLFARASADAALMSSLERAWTSFNPEEDARDWSKEIQSARSDGLAAHLLCARIAYGFGEPASAIRMAREAWHRVPDQAATAFLLCAMLLKSSDPEANRLLALCLGHFPDFTQGWRDLGYILLAHEKVEAALVCFSQGKPSFHSNMRRGLILRDLRRPGEAEAAFEAAAALDPASARAWFLIGTCRQDRGDFAGAAAAYRAVLVRDSSIAEAAVNLGMVLQENGDIDGAKAAYSQALATRADTFGRIAQALATSPKGELWLDLNALRRSLTL
jgi:tetratricopeptide (TPR) repeat protein